MSYLTQSTEELQRAVIAGLADEGFTYLPLTETFSQFLSRALGEPTAYLRKSTAQLLAELNSAFGGSGASHLTMSYAQLLDVLGAQLSGAGGGGGEEDDDMTILSSGVVSNAKYFDAVLPSGYSEFELRVWNVIANGTLDGVVSVDAGANFIQDLAQYDTYLCQQHQATNVGDHVAVSVTHDALANLQFVGTAEIEDFLIRIRPGDASHSFRIDADTVVIASGIQVVGRGVVVLNPAATITPTYGRINLFRMQCYGDGTAGNPNTTDKITSCSWLLRGFADPT